MQSSHQTSKVGTVILLILQTRIVRQNLNDLSIVAKLLYEDENPSTGKKIAQLCLCWTGSVCVCVFLKKKKCMCCFVFSNKYI